MAEVIRTAIMFAGGERRCVEDVGDGPGSMPAAVGDAAPGPNLRRATLQNPPCCGQLMAMNAS